MRTNDRIQRPRPGRRAFRRASKPTVGWGYGFLLLLALGAVFGFTLTVVPRRLEARMEEQARRALAAADLSEVHVRADGQTLVLDGDSNDAVHRAFVVLRAMRERTWLGDWAVAADVRLQPVGEEHSFASDAPTTDPAGSKATEDGQPGLESSDTVVARKEGAAAEPTTDAAASSPWPFDRGVVPAALVTPSGAELDTAEEGAPASKGVSDLLAAPNFLFIREGNTLTLTGTMTSPATRDALLATARAIVAADAARPDGLRDIKGDVEVATGAADSAASSGSGTESATALDPMPAVVRGLALLRRSVEGRASLQGGVFRFRGSALPAELAVLEQSARAPLQGTTIGLVEFQLADEPQEQCGTALDTVLDDLEVAFVADSAVMRGASARALDAVASAARGCLEPLRIEGYAVDGDGQAATSLSSRRARVVRDALRRRGIPAERLLVREYGTSGTVGGEGEHADGQQQPVEIHVVRD